MHVYKHIHTCNKNGKRGLGIEKEGKEEIMQLYNDNLKIKRASAIIRKGCREES